MGNIKAVYQILGEIPIISTETLWIYWFSIFPIISLSAQIFTSSSEISDSLLFDVSSIFPDSSLPQTLTRVSSFCDFRSSIFCFSRNVFNEASGATISDLRELIYFSLSKRFHLLARSSTFSSLNTRETIWEKVDESFSNPVCKTEKFISFSNSDCMRLLWDSISGVSFWIFSPRLPKA